MHLALATTLAVTGLAAACTPAPLGPEETLQRFLADVRYGQAETAFSALCGDTQTALRKRHARFDPKNSARGSPEAHMLFRELGLEVLQAPESVHVASPIGDTVTLRVTVEGSKSANVYLKRKADAWCIDLERTLEPRAS